MLTISYQQAIAFSKNTLKMPPESMELIKTNQLNFLREYMKHHLVRVPFQNIEMAAVDFDSRKQPTVDDIIEKGLTGNGGCCIQLNFFTMLVLKALGLEAFAIQGTHFGAPVEGTHCMVVVKLSCDEIYLVEVGGAFPILEPINMCKLPVRIMAAGGFPYEFRHVSPGIIGRYHIGGGLLSGAFVGKEEALRTSWDLKPREFSEFDYPMKATFTFVEKSVLLQNPMMCRYFSHKEIRKLHPELFNEDDFLINDDINDKNEAAEKPSHFIFIFKRTIVIGNSESRRVIKRYSSYSEMTQDISVYFPTLTLKDIKTAMGIFEMHPVSETLYDKIL